MEKLKYPQFILAVEAAPIIKALGLEEGFNEVAYEDFLREAQQYLVIRQRQHLDMCDNEGVEYKGDRRYRQLLPYIISWVVRNGQRVFQVYQRGKGTGELRLAQNNSIGYGGHIDFFDVVTEGQILVENDADYLDIPDEDWSVISLERTISDSAKREYSEEALILDAEAELVEADFVPTFQGIILDSSDAVGCLHLGLVFGVELPDGHSVSPAEEQLLEMEEQTAEELSLDTNLESWSRIYANWARG